MQKGLVLQERDIELLKFLAEYKTITLDNTGYIYGTRTYQEKRICYLVKEKYLDRLKHREVALGRRGKEFLVKAGIEIKEHCRNENNIERLKVISDIAAFTQFSDTMNFIPSWKIKDKNSPTQASRRYLGELIFDDDFYTAYAVYEGKKDKYITSLYYDLKKEGKYYNSIIFTDDIEKVWYHKDKFGFNGRHLYLIEYNEFNKRIMRNYDKIKSYMMGDLLEKHEVEWTDFKYMDFLVDNNLYLKIMLFLDINQIEYIANFLNQSSYYGERTYFICFKEHEKYLNERIKDCNVIIIEKSTVEEYIEKEYFEWER